MRVAARILDRFAFARFAVVAAALALAAAVDAPLAWDGAYYLFRVLDDRAPFVVFGRAPIAPLHWPPIVASSFTDNLAIPRFAFSAAYALVPLAALGLCWRLAKREHAPLLVWPTIGICLVCLPGQFFFVSEAIIATQLCWPVFLALMLPTSIRARLLAALLGLAALWLHPISAALFATVSVALLARGLLHTDRRRWLLASGIVAGCGSLGRLLVPLSPYEAQQASEALRDLSDAGWAIAPPALAVLIVLVVAGLIAEPRLARTEQRHQVLVWTGLTLAGALLVVWASIPTLWVEAVRFRTVIPLLTLPLLGFAALDLGRAERRPDQGWGESTARNRARAVTVSALVFALALVAQAVGWRGMTLALEREIARAPGACMDASTSVAGRGPAARVLALTPHSILLQSRSPNTVHLQDARCDSGQDPERGAGGMAGGPLVWIYRGAECGGWFDLHRIEPHLAKEMVALPFC